MWPVSTVLDNMDLETKVNNPKTKSAALHQRQTQTPKEHQGGRGWLCPREERNGDIWSGLKGKSVSVIEHCSPATEGPPFPLLLSSSLWREPEGMLKVEQPSCDHVASKTETEKQKGSGDITEPLNQPCSTIVQISCWCKKHESLFAYASVVRYLQLDTVSK